MFTYRRMLLAALMLLLSAFGTSHAQIFSKVETGPVVTDVHDSWGCNWVDFDDDGFLDLFVTNLPATIGEDNNLYRNNRDGTFTKIIEGALVSDGGGALGASWGDYDNDLDLDVLVLNIGTTTIPSAITKLYRNNGDGDFENVTDDLGQFFSNSTTSCSWSDYDNDGDLDVFVAGGGGSFSNAMLENQGDGTFIDVTNTVGLADTISSWACNWVDYDDDHDPDLFVAETGGNVLYRNDGGQFSKLSDNIVVTDNVNARGGSWGDYDNDGDLDLLVTTDNGLVSALYENKGGGAFQKVEGRLSEDAALSLGSSWGDLDNDGDLDLFVANEHTHSFLHLNDGDGTFTRVVDDTAVSAIDFLTGCAFADYDNDGDLDLFVANSVHGENFLYENVGSTGNWLNIKCVGSQSNRSAIGARVRARARIAGKTVWQTREVSAQTGFVSQNSLNVEFGFGDAQVVDSLIIHWPASGIIDRFGNIAANQFLTVVEGDGITAVPPRPLLPRFELKQNYPNPFNPTTTIAYSISERAFVTIKIFNMLGHEIATLLASEMPAGDHTVEWDAIGVPSGVYVYRLSVQTRKGQRNAARHRKLVLLK